MSEWESVAIGDISNVVTGTTPPSSFDDNWGDSIPFLTPSDITGADYAPRTQRRLSNIAAERHKARVVPVGSVAVVCIGSTIGKVALINEPTLTNQQINTLVPKNGHTDARFLYYCLQLKADHLKVISSGSATPIIAKRSFSVVHIDVPPLEEQRRIAGVLGALDDLIETNRDLINKLMSTAQVVFSGIRAKTATKVSYADVVDVGGGGTPSTKNPSFWGGFINWVTPSDMTALPSPFLFNSSRKITSEGLTGCSSELYPAGSILMTSRATIGVFAIAMVPTAVNQGFIVVKPRVDTDRSYLLLEMMSRVGDYHQQANGSTFLELSRGKFKTLLLPWPSDVERMRFDKQVRPLLTAAGELEREIADLTRTRDELLPLLMSGRVRVRGDLSDLVSTVGRIGVAKGREER